MSVAELKERLHKAIEETDDERFLEALLTIATVQQNESDYDLSDEQIRLLEERHERYLRGEEKEISLDEFKASMKAKYGI